jgi:hypothetical protein
VASYRRRTARLPIRPSAGPGGADGVALDRATARKGSYRIGDRVRVATNGPLKEYTPTGVFTTEDGAVNAGGSLVLFDTPVAQRLFLRPGFFEDVGLTAAAGVPDRTILKGVVPLLPDNATAKTGNSLAADQARQIERRPREGPKTPDGPGPAAKPAGPGPSCEPCAFRRSRLPGAPGRVPGCAGGEPLSASLGPAARPRRFLSPGSSPRGSG